MIPTGSRVFGALVAAMLLVAACAPAAPSPTAAPAKPEAAPAAKPGDTAPASKPAAAQPAGKPTTVAEIALYQGADRQQVLEEGAKKEGKLVWYTTYIVDQIVRPLLAAFKQKYPFIEVEFFRATGGELVQKAVTEFRAAGHSADVLNGIDSVALIKQAKYTQPFYSPQLEAFTPDLKDPEGQWGATVQYFYVIGYSKQLVPEGQQPKTYQDLLDPKWSGKMAMTTASGTGGPLFTGFVQKSMGEQQGKEYLTQLAKQNIRLSTASNRAILDQVIGGEFSVEIMALLNHSLISVKAGAPMGWTEPQPMLGNFDNAGLLKDARNPHAAMLLLDFLFSPEGQKVMSDSDYTPARPGVDAKDPQSKPPARGVKVEFMSPDVMVSQGTAWQQLFEQLFVK
jgi:iron(III) transport system substrate-binding protein